jgi:protein-disulfide isomerase
MPKRVAAASLLFLLLIVSGSARAASTADPFLPAFGEGPVEVRVFTDYFCEPCRAEEREVIALITELVERNRIRVVFVDTPIHRETILYVAYFLAAANAKREFGRTIAARTALFEAAGMGINEKSALEAFLMKKKIELRPFDTTSVYTAFGNYIKEDRISSTPTLVIIGPRGKEILHGREQILAALHDLKQ